MLLVAVAGMVAISALALSSLSEARLEDRIFKLRSLVESSHSLAQGLHDRTIAEGGSVQDAIAAFQAINRPVRYAGEEYMFMHGLDGVVMSLPPRPDLEGRSILAVEDPTGFRIVEAMLCLLYTSPSPRD